MLINFFHFNTLGTVEIGREAGLRLALAAIPCELVFEKRRLTNAHDRVDRFAIHLSL